MKYYIHINFEEKLLYKADGEAVFLFSFNKWSKPIFKTGTELIKHGFTRISLKQAQRDFPLAFKKESKEETRRKNKAAINCHFIAPKDA